MKTITIQGVPFSVADDKAYIYGTETQIGVYKAEKLTLNDSWEKSKAVEASLQEYRDKLKLQTTAALEKAAELQKA